MTHTDLQTAVSVPDDLEANLLVGVEDELVSDPLQREAGGDAVRQLDATAVDPGLQRPVEVHRVAAQPYRHHFRPRLLPRAWAVADFDEERVALAVT